MNKGINAHTEKYFQKNNFYKQKTISLFSYPVAPSSNTTTGWLELLVHIQQIIVADQYSIGELVGRDSVIFDIGANVGIFSIGAARKATGGKIFSFEPGAATYAVLKQNMDPYPNVATYHYALGDSSGEQTLFTPGYESAMASLDRDFAVLYKKDAPVKTEKVTVRTVDDMADELKLKKLDLIKIDAEGSEMKILRGSSRTIASFHPIIVVSAYHRAEDRQEIPDFIKRIDPKYKTKLMDSAEEDFVFIPAR